MFGMSINAIIIVKYLMIVLSNLLVAVLNRFNLFIKSVLPKSEFGKEINLL